MAGFSVTRRGLADATGRPKTVASVVSGGGEQYVETTGSDTNDGLGWGANHAKLTIAAAVAALPSKGGIVWVGYGGFPVSGLAGLPGVTIRGMGCGRAPDEVPTPAANPHPTYLVNTTAATDAINIGATATGARFALEDLAVVGTSSTRHGINFSNAANVRMRNVISYGHGGYGILFFNTYWIELDTVMSVQNGTVGSSDSGGMKTGGPVNLITAENCRFNANFGCGVNLGSGGAVNFIGTDFSVNVANASQTGRGVQSTPTGSFCQYNFTGCWFEKNAAEGLKPTAAGAVYTFTGCQFPADSVQTYGVATAGATDTMIFAGCYGENHASGNFLIDNTNVGRVIWLGGTFSGNLIKGLNPGIQSYGSFGPLLHGATMGTSVSTQTLAANGAVAINADQTDLAEITLQANATSSTLTGGQPGQTLTISWAQDGTGSRTYAWPTNVRFTGNAAPTASTGAGRIDAVTFRKNSSNAVWREIGRSINGF